MEVIYFLHMVWLGIVTCIVSLSGFQAPHTTVGGRVGTCLIFRGGWGVYLPRGDFVPCSPGPEPTPTPAQKSAIPVSIRLEAKELVHRGPFTYSHPAVQAKIVTTIPFIRDMKCHPLTNAAMNYDLHNTQKNARGISHSIC